MVEYILRHGGFIALVIESVTVGRVGLGRPRLGFVKLIIRNVGAETKRMTQDRVNWRHIRFP